MKKSLFLFATAALMLSACSNDSDVVQDGVSLAQQSGPQAVAFDTYTSSATKAGHEGVMKTTDLQTWGFGVFAQHSNDGGYDNSTNPSNFMWNQKVEYTTAWTYSPLKYWPNETTLDSQTPAATSTNTDKLSFFAYAPYVKELTDVYTGKLTGPTYSADPAINNSNISADGGGIEAVIANNVTGNDPWVRYSVATKPSKSVDLLWGVAPAGGLQYQSVNPTDNATYNINIAQGMPLVDLVKPAKDQKIKFLFQHALARIGMTVVAAVDQIAAGGNLDGQTKIAVKSVAITETTPTKVLFTSGALNLKNGIPFQSNWTNTSGEINLSVNNEDGGELNPNIAYKTNASTTWNQSAPWTGVTNAEKNVIADNKYFMVIPTHEDATLQVVITYAVITKDAKVAGGYSEVENVITKAVTIPDLTNNKAYNLKLILGLTSVKLDAEVADWQIDGSNEVYLPQNTGE